MKTRLLVFILFILTVFSSVPVYAMPSDPVNFEELEEILSFDESRLGSVKMISVPFEIAFRDGIFEWEFPYTDDFFRYPSDHFSKTFAQGSLGLAVSAFRKEFFLPYDPYEEYLSAAGFTDIQGFGYDQPTSQDSLSGVIAVKKIDDFTVLACSACGQGYDKEWCSNLDMGDEERHKGFDHGADILKEQIDAYRRQHDIQGKVKLWITGFSRSAAVGNLTAADLYKSGQYEDVYAYLFAVPRTTKKPEMLSGIYNICGQFDPVTNIPFQSWGYERYGRDLYTPAQESNSDYAVLRQSASEVHEQISGKQMRNSPDCNHHLHTILEFMEDMIPTAADYQSTMREHIMSIWTSPDQEHVFDILIMLMSRLSEMDKTMEYSSDIFINYVSWLMAEHLRGDEEPKDEEYWDPEATMPANYLREHQPLTYISWMFSDNDKLDLLDGGQVSRLIVIYGDFDLKVYDTSTDPETLVGSVDRDGTVLYADPEREKMFMEREGTDVTIYVPLEGHYRFEMTSDVRQVIAYDESEYTAGEQEAYSDYFNMITINKGTYELFINPSREMGEFLAVEGKTYDYFKSDDGFSVYERMLSESIRSDHLNFLDLFYLVIGILAVLAALGIACIIIALIHRHKKKKGKGPFSHLWVIIPHLIVIVMFAGLTQFCVYHLYVVWLAKAVPSAITVGFIFLVALRAYMRNRNRTNLVLMVLMAAATPLTFFLFANSPVVRFSAVSMSAFVVIIFLLTALSVRGFWRKPKACSV